MSKTVNLELLRHGPPHNQLISPITSYLALCDNHPAETVRLPFEHRGFLHRERALAYPRTGSAAELQANRMFHLDDMATHMREFLEGIPGLLRECADDSESMHLHLVLSANELSILPFELANAPRGHSGFGEPLLLQPRGKFSLTRGVRRVNRHRFSWPEKPRILFVAAEPEEAGSVPMEEHYAVLRQAVDAWVGTDDPGAGRSAVEEHLLLLPEATFSDLQDALGSEKFSYVHILAHGVLDEDIATHTERFALAFHDERDPRRMEKVSGERLRSVLGGTDVQLVSLASCDSARQGGMISPGGSIAHELHDAGVPIVIGSQFPLSKAGSVYFAQTLYKELVRGDDVRDTLCDIRLELARRLAHRYHDWASLVIYAGIPEDFEAKCSAVRVNQAIRSIDLAMDLVDDATEAEGDYNALGARSREVYTRHRAGESSRREMSDSDPKPAWTRFKELFENGKRDLLRVADREPDLRVQVYGRLASAEKRYAERVNARPDILDNPMDGPSEDGPSVVKERAKNAAAFYQKAFDSNPKDTWGLVQRMVLDAFVLGKDISEEEWTTARHLATKQSGSGDLKHAVWALSDLIELILLRPKLPRGRISKSRKDKAKALAGELTGHWDEAYREIFSIRRQLLRYPEWFCKDDTKLGPVKNLAEDLLHILPDSVPATVTE